MCHLYQSYPPLIFSDDDVISRFLCILEIIASLTITHRDTNVKDISAVWLMWDNGISTLYWPVKTIQKYGDGGKR